MDEAIAASGKISTIEELGRAHEYRMIIERHEAFLAQSDGPSFLDIAWVVISWPFLHPVFMLSLVLIGVVLFLASLASPVRDPFEIFHRMANPYCACHRCNPEMREKRWEGTLGLFKKVTGRRHGLSGPQPRTQEELAYWQEELPSRSEDSTSGS